MNKLYKACSRMKLNSFLYTDDGFNKGIVFVAEELVNNDIPIWHEYNNIKDMLIKAYSLKLDDKLNGISILDNDRNCTTTDALNCFDDIDNIEQIKRMRERESELEKELLLYKEFLNKYNANETFNKFKESILQ